MPLTQIQTESDYKNMLNSSAFCVVHFLADFAAECGSVTAVLEELKKECSTAEFYEIEAEKMAEISMKHEIVAVPTVILFRAGKAVDRVDGANAAELTSKVKAHFAQGGSGQTNQSKTPEEPKEDLDTKLKRLINAHKCMLFMKGNPTEPKCGFSRQTIAILDGINVQYGTFDILNDDSVRQGLKTFSNWPTYPQLYLDGELLGGLDIIKEMLESGELESMLPKKVKLEDRLKSLVNKAPIMVFMKGEPDVPKCGFSRQLMEILKETNLAFNHFDILTDEEVRQGLKTFSNWPTYPQVYVQGELIGGLDIIKELKGSGDLVPTLKGEA